MMNRATLLKRTSTRAFSESRDGNKRMRGGDQTAATKAAMAEAKVAN
jgi:hypothetical protein